MGKPARKKTRSLTHRVTGSGSRRPSAKRQRLSKPLAVQLPPDQEVAQLKLGERMVRLTHLQKLFWPHLGITKGELLQYYADIALVILPHLQHRAMVMKRYPGGANGPFFFMKRAPAARPKWIDICEIRHASGNKIDFAVVDDLASLLWLVNLGCIDLNPWYARCDDVHRPDYLHFDLDPVKGANFEQVCEVALLLRGELQKLSMPTFAKTTGSRGMHIYIPIVRGPAQKQVWSVAKRIARQLAAKYPQLITAEYRIAKRPKSRVLVDYNQNAWGRTLASVYSVRPTPQATVSMPVTWQEVTHGIQIDDFHLGNALERIRRVGDLWQPLLAKRDRFALEKLL